MIDATHITIRIPDALEALVFDGCHITALGIVAVDDGELDALDDVRQIAAEAGGAHSPKGWETIIRETTRE